MFAVPISPGLDVVLLVLSPQLRLFHVEQLADLRDGEKFLQILVVM